MSESDRHERPQRSRSDLALAKGLAHHQQNRFKEAVTAYDEALSTAPTCFAAIVNKGAALRRLGRQEEAMACYWRALALEPDNAQIWCNAANAMLDLGRVAEARVALQVALAKAPMMSKIWVALSRSLAARQKSAAAELCLRRTVAIAPTHAEARMQLATLLLERGKASEALVQFEIIRAQAPDDPSAQSGAAQCLMRLGRLDDADPFLKRALTLDPDHLDSRLGMARLALLRGDFESGWRLYDWCRRHADVKPPKLASNEWDGSDPAGKTLLVYAEQDFGDVLQFLRYLPLLAERGAKIIMVCQTPLLPLVESVRGVIAAQAHWRLPPHDCHLPLLSLPHKLGFSEIPLNLPYVSTQREIARLPEPIGTKMKVGIVWAGSSTHAEDHNGLASLDVMLPLTGIAGVACYSLQIGASVADLSRCAHPALLTDLGSKLKDFADGAAALGELDLLITVDTSIAHLAGALGKPVWVMIPKSPDWRWQLKRDDTPWYPSMRLFRQDIESDWAHVVERMLAALQRWADERSAPREPDWLAVNSAIGENPETPRYRLDIPRHFMSDAGVAFLARKERAGIAYEYATRSFLDAHLRPGDLFLDIGAHWGIMALHAATRFKNEGDAGTEIKVLAFEPAPENQQQLRRWARLNNLESQIALIPAAVSNVCGKGALKPDTTMGHTLIRDDGGAVAVTTIDATLAERPDLAHRRVIVKIDVEGQEPEVIAGMEQLLASGRVAAIIWERGQEYNADAGQDRLRLLQAKFIMLGFSLWRFAVEDEGGTLLPFLEDGSDGNVIALASGIEPLESYRSPRLPASAQPVDPLFDATEKARALFQDANTAHTTNKFGAALKLYAESAAIDSRPKALWNNLGVALRHQERYAAASAAYHRALAVSPNDVSVMSNLGNVQREMGQLAKAAETHAKAMETSPVSARLLYNAALVPRDDGRPAEARALLDRVLDMEPDHARAKWDRALALLQAGDYAEGLPAYEARWGLARMPKRDVPLPRWDGSPLDGKALLLYDEQGFGDTLQFARFISEAKKRGAGKIVLECQPELARLMAMAPAVDIVVPRGRAIPPCDVCLPLLSLPGLFGITVETLGSAPYLSAPLPSPDTMRALPNDGRKKVGIVWAGKTTPRDRSIPLDLLLRVLHEPAIAPISLQMGPRGQDLEVTGADAFVTDMAPYLHDFAETAAVLKQLDSLVTIDTSVAHLAGALAVPTHLLLRYTSDWRWFDRIDHSPWYPSFRLWRQGRDCRWDTPLSALAATGLT